MATGSKPKGFSVICPICRDEDATVSIDLNNLAECRCSGCDETFSPKRARDLAAAELARWEAILRWVDLAANCVTE